MKIALVHRLYTRAGGVEKNVVLLAEGLAARGHEVHVFCHRADEPVKPGIVIRDVKIVRLGMAMRYWSFARNAAAMLSGERFDVVQGFDLTFSQDVLRVGRGLMKVYRPLLLQTRGPLARWWKKVDPEGRAMQRLEERMLERGSWKRIVALSQRGKRELVEAYAIPASEIEVIPNGVDLVRWNPAMAAEGRAASRAKFGLSATDRVLLFVGTGFRRKGLDTLIGALAALEGVKLLVVGRDGAERSYRRHAARLGLKDRVIFAGQQRADAALYGAADVVALPTRYEPFGNVVLEALSCGVPALVSAAAGAADVYGPDHRAFVVENFTSPSAWHMALAKIFENTPGAAECRAIAERFSESECVARYEALFRTIAGSEAARAGAAG